MYVGREGKAVESICYKEGHIMRVIATIQDLFERYYSSYIFTDAGRAISEEDFQRIGVTIGLATALKAKPINHARVLKGIITSSIDMFEGDRPRYLKLLDL